MHETKLRVDIIIHHAAASSSSSSRGGAHPLAVGSFHRKRPTEIPTAPTPWPKYSVRSSTISSAFFFHLVFFSSSSQVIEFTRLVTGWLPSLMNVHSILELFYGVIPIEFFDGSFVCLFFCCFLCVCGPAGPRRRSASPAPARMKQKR